MQVVRTVGLDITKSIFQVHGVDGAGQVVIRRQLKRRMSWHSSRSCQRAWWASMAGAHRIIGRASSRRSAAQCG